MTRCGQMSLRPSTVRSFPRWSVKVCSPGIWFTYRTSAYPLMDSSPALLLPMRKPLPGSNSPQVSMGTYGFFGLVASRSWRGTRWRRTGVAAAAAATRPSWNSPLQPSATHTPSSS